MINAFVLCDLFEYFKNIIQQTEKEALKANNCGRLWPVDGFVISRVLQSSKQCYKRSV